MTLGLLQLAVLLSAEDWSYRHVWPFLYFFYAIGRAEAIQVGFEEKAPVSNQPGRRSGHAVPPATTLP